MSLHRGLRRHRKEERRRVEDLKKRKSRLDLQFINSGPLNLLPSTALDLVSFLCPLWKPLFLQFPPHRCPSVKSVDRLFSSDETENEMALTAGQGTHADGAGGWYDHLFTLMQLLMLLRQEHRDDHRRHGL